MRHSRYRHPAGRRLRRALGLCRLARPRAGSVELLSIHGSSQSTTRWPRSGSRKWGPFHEGMLSEAREARISLDLPLGCVTIVAIGGEGVRDIDATLLDPHGSALAHDTTAEPQAVLRACLESADTYSLVVKIVSGTGPWVVATWVGGAAEWCGHRRLGDREALSALREAKGTCEAPIPPSSRRGRSAVLRRSTAKTRTPAPAAPATRASSYTS